jgi:predicted RNA-binding protein with TRAM domain
VVYQYLVAAVGLGAIAIYKNLKGEEGPSETPDDNEGVDREYPEGKKSPHKAEGSSKNKPENAGKSDSNAEKKRFSAGINDSRIAHEDAQERPPPVVKGETYEVVPEDETRHRSGRRDLIAKYRRFTVFIENAPKSIEIGDRVTVRITGFGPDMNAAHAILENEI